jgi:hypothetical protein
MMPVAVKAPTPAPASTKAVKDLPMNEPFTCTERLERQRDPEHGHSLGREKTQPIAPSIHPSEALCQPRE